MKRFQVITLAQAIEAMAAQTIYVDDYKCVNKVQARDLSIKHRPRLGRYDVTYKVGLYRRSFKTRNTEQECFYVEMGDQS